MNQRILYPKDLSGPRSYFTDLDPNDPFYDALSVKRKLKLLMLTKEKITIAASSLFTKVGYTLFSQDDGLSKALEAGIIIPALRNVYINSDHFFQERETDCPKSGQKYFRKYVAYVLPWDVKDNSTWFMNTFYKHITNPKSILREHLPINDEEALNTRFQLDKKVTNRENGFLTREDVEDSFSSQQESVQEYVKNYVNLLYRIFGSKAVFCESHFPQSNLTSIGIEKGDSLISDENVFWDIYIEAIISFFNSAIRLTPERLDSMIFEDILKIRETIFDPAFRIEYDNLVKMAKDSIKIEDPEKMFLKEDEITNAAHQLRRKFSDRIEWEISDIRNQEREKSLGVLANVLASITTSSLSSIINILSNCLAIPEITSLLSPSLGSEMKRRIDAVRLFLNSKSEWSNRKRQILLKRYKEFICFGLPNIN